MNCTFMPSLKRRALVEVSAALWNRSDLRDLVPGCLTLPDSYTAHAEKWREIQDKVIGIVRKLPLPVSLKKEVFDLAQQMPLQVIKWKKYHRHRNRHLDIDVSAELCWTPQGTVDRKKTAEVLVKDERIDITTRYRLACFYCLEDNVKELWNSMPERKKKDIYDEEGKNSHKNMLCWGLTAVWSCYVTDSTAFYDLIKKRAGKEVSFYQFWFEFSAKYANKAAAEHFLQKITPRERDVSLVKCARDLAHKHLIFLIKNSDDCDISQDSIEGYDTEMLCFLLSQMNVDQQVEVFEYCPAGVLSCLLDWPWQNLFMETANRVWDVLSEDHYEMLLRVMVYGEMGRYKNCNYRKLFGEFWQQSPNKYKKYVAGRLKTNRNCSLYHFFYIGDKENIRLIFQNMTLEERRDIILSDKGLFACENLIHMNEWDLLKFYLLEGISSEDVMFEIEECLKKIISTISFRSEKSLESKNNLWTKFLQFRDELHEDYVKRCRVKGIGIQLKDLSLSSEQQNEILQRINVKYETFIDIII